MKFRLSTLVLLILLSCSRVSAQERNNYDIRVVDSNNELGADREGILLNLRAALDEWTRYIPGIPTLQTEVRVIDNTASGRFSGRADSAVWLNDNGQKVLEECTTHKLRTGSDTNGTKPDIIIEIQPNFMRKSYWIDPEPFKRTKPVPQNKIDLVTVFAHELGHALGINGRLNRTTGVLPSNETLSQFDSHIVNPTSSAPAFRGQFTNTVYGADLPLTRFTANSEPSSFTSKGKKWNAGLSASQNYYHYGRYTLPNENPLSLFGLMAGGWPYPKPAEGLRIPVGPLDVAIMKDLGIPTR